MTEFWYNTSPHSPFIALYGHEPRYWGIEANCTCPVPAVQEWLEERKLMHELIKHNLNHAKQQMKSQADKNRTAREFAVGDSVFIKLQPYV
jgi:hypothetical protein